MPDYRRHRLPGGSYFFTVNLLERKSDLLIRNVDVLREAVRYVRQSQGSPDGVQRNPGSIVPGFHDVSSGLPC